MQCPGIAFAFCVLATMDRDREGVPRGTTPLGLADCRKTIPDRRRASPMLLQTQLPDSYLTLSDEALEERISRRRRDLRGRVVILGHHYQQDRVIRHADFTGDSFKLSQLAADRVRETGAKVVVFCGVHFMAESADILTPDDVKVILPDLSAGCSMADMADYDDTVHAWETIHRSLADQGWRGRIIPITYMNSSAAIKAFCGQHGGVVCTSSNAARVFEWAMQGGTEARDAEEDIKIMFLPDQHLGRNTAHAYGIDVGSESTVWDPKAEEQGDPLGGTTHEALRAAKVILWKGHCSVHQLFRPEHIRDLRQSEPDRKIIVHPECSKEVVDLADTNGSTEKIIRTIEQSAPGEKWAVGTEHHLVDRVAAEVRERGIDVISLSGCQCLCTTMYRIDPERLLWVLDNLAEGNVVNQITVHEQAREYALVSLGRMLELSA
jgi:quinolinate synthase